MNALVLGWRNLHRNFRRTLVTGLSVVCGFTALGLFSGYTATAYEGLAAQAIHGELLGHLTIVKQGFRSEGGLNPAKFLLSRDEAARVEAIVGHEVQGARVVPRLALDGLLSNGRVSTIFLAEGIAPADMRVLRGPRLRASGLLSEDAPNAVTASRGLARMLGLKTGSDASVLVSTVNGQANAMDVRIADTFSTGNLATDNKFLYVPLALAQSLDDAEGRVDRLTVLLPDAGATEATRTVLRSKLKAAGLAVEVETWEELSAFYRQVKAMLDMVFGFLVSIVLAVVVMSVANAMSMSVVERTREIGTLRAVGVRSSGVVGLFVLEAMLLVAVACGVGLLVTLAASYAINEAGITYRPPNSTDDVPLLVGFDGLRLAFVAAMLCFLSAAASFIPARGAARQPIVESLIHA